ncbi:hypothetical protein K435DRAFT_781167 [Dendrothele bispora CBS 962.96]|uniref:Hemerythrin-like domain-containing protein n=1 Tax=Dendrothele bispora (strain CBS 962.96) TaxID=1314807 RepID=A0A4S8LNR6_DENBC|nr:hypothetical protein K435DRAFT_781167 [Dendrothele bispora CBS 962.96]
MAGNDMKTFEDPTVRKYVEKIQNVATMERPELASGRAGWAMAWLHLAVWNSWKSAYFYADKYEKDDFKNYIDYALYSAEFLVGHHDAEEASLFPEIEKKAPGSMEKNEAQHQSFLKQLGDLVEYLKSAKADTFDATTYRAKVDEILAPIMEHLADELDTLESSELLKHFTEEELAVINKATHQSQQGQSGGAFKSLPFLLQNLPPSSPFPPAPKFVTNILGPWVFYWKFSPLWKYTAYPFKPVLSPSVPK